MSSCSRLFRPLASLARASSLLGLGLLLAWPQPACADWTQGQRPPVPQTVSRELQALIAHDPALFQMSLPEEPVRLRAFVERTAQGTASAVKDLQKQLHFAITPGTMAGVPVFTITPDTMAPGCEDLVLLHLHGGGYVLYPGLSCTWEAGMMAGMTGMKVVSVDYRMPPDHPYPAAMDDALAVYKELLKTHPASAIGVFGSSTGGGMTLALALRARDEGLPLPGALAPCTPWSDLAPIGDSYATNAGLDNVLVTYDNWLADAVRLYAQGQDLTNPYLSPVYGDFAGFPPTLLVSGTRDLFLSNTVRVHLKMRALGVPADLIVHEGMSHVQYYMDPNMPEARFHFQELGRFFRRHLRPGTVPAVQPDRTAQTGKTRVKAAQTPAQLSGQLSGPVSGQASGQAPRQASGQSSAQAPR